MRKYPLFAPSFERFAVISFSHIDRSPDIYAKEAAIILGYLLRKDNSTIIGFKESDPLFNTLSLIWSRTYIQQTKMLIHKTTCEQPF